ncbi:MAG: hypothetical protein PUB93_00080 [Firmicutes bacterium]|nr:hypothetical protein [Bacillota bacterium]
MTDNELKRMTRAELLQMLIAQAEEVTALRAQLSDAQAQLRDRRIAIDEAGSIAEAALRLNGIFDAAQAAAGQYLDNIREISSHQEALARRTQAEAERKAQEIIDEANAYSVKVHAEADQYRQRIREQTQKDNAP